MLDIGFPGHIVNLLVNLYRKHTAKILIAGTLFMFSDQTGIMPEMNIMTIFRPIEHSGRNGDQ